MKYISLYLHFLILQFKTILEYKTDFWIGIFSVILGQINTFLLTLVVFTQLDVLAGFSIVEIFLMYGFYVLVKGIDHFYNDNIWSFAWNKIKDGRFTEILLRPINPIFYIVMERIEISGLSEMIIGIGIVTISSKLIGLSLSVLNIIGLIVILLCGLSIFFSVKLLFSAPAFWTVCCGEFMTAGLEISNSSRYPLSLYKNNIIKNVLLYLLPFPLAAYFPTIYCLGQKSVIFGGLGISISGEQIVLYSIIIACFLLFISIKIWYIGLKRFEPTGT